MNKDSETKDLKDKNAMKTKIENNNALRDSRVNNEINNLSREKTDR